MDVCNLWGGPTVAGFNKDSSTIRKGLYDRFWKLCDLELYQEASIKDDFKLGDVVIIPELVYIICDVEYKTMLLWSLSKTRWWLSKRDPSQTLDIHISDICTKTIVGSGDKFPQNRRTHA